MESDGVSRAPLTRSRRRISLEQVEEVKTPVTPTKKRSRAAAKPQLDDIDENTPINSPRKSRRQSLKDSLDVVKSDTPTSVLTPARRSSRVISNTSITSESIHNYESPRALRATRRLSRTGSDADTPTLTPTKTLRRTRRSITNNDSSGESSNPVSQQLINEVIPEETEQQSSSTKSHNKEKVIKVRKSPRLSGKSDSENNTPEKDKPLKQNNDDNKPNNAETQSSVSTTNETVQELPKNPLNKDLNKTVPCYDSNKRNRTDSLNISGKSEDISVPSFFSDNEGGKVKKVKKSRKNMIPDKKENIKNQDQVDACFISHNEGLVSMGRISKIKSQIVVEHVKDDLHPKADFIEDSNSCSPDKVATLMNQEPGDQCVPEVEPITDDKNILQHKLSTTLSSNTETIGFMSKRDRTATDLSYEPMDIDETIPENVTVQDYSNENIESPIKSKPTDTQEKEISNTSQNVTNNINKSSLNKSKAAKTSMQAFEIDKNQNNTNIEDSKKNKSNNKKHNKVDVSEIVLNKSSNSDSITLDGPQSDAKNKKIQGEGNRKFLDTPIKMLTQNILSMQTSTPVDNQPKLSKNISEKYDDSDIQRKQVKKGKKAKLLESDESSDESDVTNKLVIEEVEEAPDDYESGDSMDTSERQYLEENEIIEKGESIGSDTTDCSSEESDYDKDSFLVSSNEEDNELLSGSGDDLSMSDNELSMSTKSKAKFDKRKLKEQKQASREMYEARHGKKKNNSDSSIVSKKNKNLSSSSQDQDQEISVIKGIRHNRMRIESEVTETEISAIVNDSIMDKQDPLEKAIKVEPKTPQNSFNISSANIQPNVEHLEIDENTTLMKSNTTHDPLENMSNDDDSSLGSENEEIKENYDSLLNNLNKDKRNHEKKIPKIQENGKTIKDSEVSDSDTSDSIDMKLLFPENNGDSDNSNGNHNNKNEVFSSDENFIPLKRVEGKTNLRESEDAITNSKMKKNKKLSETMPIPLDRDSSKLLIPKKNKMLSQSLTTQAEHVTNQLLNAEKKKISSESSIANQSGSDANQSLNSKKKKTSSETSMTNQSESEANQSLNSKKKKISSETSMTNQSESEANKSLNSKKKKISSETSMTNQSESEANKSLNSKKKKTTSETSMTNQSESEANQSFNSKNTKISSEYSMANQSGSDANQSLNSKKKKTSSESSVTNQSECDAKQSLTSKKKKTSMNNQTEHDGNLSLESKEKKTLSESSISLTEQDANQSLNSKKNKTSSQSSIPNQTELDSNKSFNSKLNRSILESSFSFQTEHDSYQSLKLKKNKTSSDSSTIQEHDANQSFKTKKNKMSSLLIHSEYEPKQSLNLDKKEQKMKKTKNKLRQSSGEKENYERNKGNEVLHKFEQNIDPKSSTGNINVRKGQKRKMSDSLVESSSINKTEQDLKPMNNKKKKKQAQSDVLEENTNYSAINVRKRKQRPEEGEGEDRKNKVLSGFLDKLPIPRLPTTVLDQLDEKAKTNAFSTTKFSVENTTKRKMKPSEYLEDSVYLNSQSPEKKRRKKLLRKPKVLPFVPTACTSGSGFTTSFQISIVPKVVEFVAQSSIASNFKKDKMKHTKQSASKYKPQKKTANMTKY